MALVDAAGRPCAATADRLPYLAVALAVFCWGLGPLFVRAISASAVTISFWRMWLAVPISYAVVRLSGQRLTWRVVRVAAPAGALFSLSIVLGFASFQQTSIANATLIGSMAPVLIMVAAGPLFGERITRRRVALAGVSLVGAALVVIGAGGTGGASLRGDLLAVANLVGFTVYFLEVKRRRSAGVPSNAYLAGIFLTGAVVLTPYALLASNDLSAVDGTDWWWLLLMVLVPGTAGHGLMTWAQGHVDVTVSSLMTLASPVVSTIGAWLVYDQTLRAVQVLGAALVLVGIAGVVVSQRIGLGRPTRVVAAEPAT